MINPTLEIYKYRNSKFAWGQLDCCLYAANVLKAITGIDYAKDLRNRYSTKFGATRVIKESGAKDVIDIVSNQLNSVPLRDVDNAKLGDLVAKKEGKGYSIGVCDGTFGVFIGEEGLYLFNKNKCLYYWKTNINE